MVLKESGLLSVCRCRCAIAFDGLERTCGSLCVTGMICSPLTEPNTHTYLIRNGNCHKRLHS